MSGNKTEEELAHELENTNQDTEQLDAKLDDIAGIAAEEDDETF